MIESFGDANRGWMSSEPCGCCVPQGLNIPKRIFPCKTPAEVRAGLPANTDVVAFQCRNPIHRAHYELFTRALDAPNVGKDAVCLVHPTVGPTQDDGTSQLCMSIARYVRVTFHPPKRASLTPLILIGHLLLKCRHPRTGALPHL